MLGVLFSGGKDSVFTLYYYLEQGWEVACLVSLVSSNEDSWMFHTPAISLVSLQAEALGIPLLKQNTRGEKEAELIDLEKALAKAKKKFGLDAIAVGALLSDYQHERVNRICHSLGLKCFAPLWHKSQEKLLREIVSLGFDVRIAGVASQGLGEGFLGKRIDSGMLEVFSRLNAKTGFHFGGEGGEYESMVLDGPIFRKKICIEKTRPAMSGPMSGRLEIGGASLEEKLSFAHQRLAVNNRI